MKINIKLLLPIVILFSLLGCSSQGIYKQQAHPIHQNHVKSARYIIKSASLEVSVDVPTDTLSEMKALVKSKSGFVQSIYDNDEKTISMTAKIPQGQLESFVEEASKKGKLISKNISSQDVTGELIDIEAKVKNLKVLRARFRELLARANNIDEVLKIEKELVRIQSEIDSIEGRVKSLKQHALLSDVSIMISQKTIYGPLGYIGHGMYWLVKKLFVIQ